MAYSDPSPSSTATYGLNYLYNKIAQLDGLTGGSACPIFREEFSTTLPPYLATCGHNLSYQAIKKLSRTTIRGPNGRLVCRVIRCPVCKRKFTHATLHYRLLDLIVIKNEVKTLIEHGKLDKLTPLTDPYIGKYPLTYIPSKGLLSKVNLNLLV